MIVAFAALIVGAILVYAGITGQSVVALLLGQHGKQATGHNLLSGGA